MPHTKEIFHKQLILYCLGSEEDRPLLRTSTGLIYFSPIVMSYAQPNPQVWRQWGLRMAIPQAILQYLRREIRVLQSVTNQSFGRKRQAHTCSRQVPFRSMRQWLRSESGSSGIEWRALTAQTQGCGPKGTSPVVSDLPLAVFCLILTKASHLKIATPPSVRQRLTSPDKPLTKHSAATAHLFVLSTKDFKLGSELRTYP